MTTQMIISIAIIAILVISFIICVAWQIKKQGLRNFASELIVQAEKEFNKGENKEKLDYVVEKLIAIIPAPFSLFITTSMVKKMVQEVFNMCKKALDYQPENIEKGE